MGEMQDRQVACRGCGHFMARTAKFCGKCGVTQPAAPAASTTPTLRDCPYCGHACKAGTQFCGKCGGRFGGPAPTPSSPMASDGATDEVALDLVSGASATSLDAPSATPQAPQVAPEAEQHFLSGEARPVPAVQTATRSVPDSPTVTPPPSTPDAKQRPVAWPADASNAPAKPGRAASGAPTTSEWRQRTPWIAAGVVMLVLLVAAVWFFSGSQRPVTSEEASKPVQVRPTLAAEPSAPAKPENPPEVSVPVLPQPSPAPVAPASAPVSAAAPAPITAPAPAKVATPPTKPEQPPAPMQKPLRRQRAEVADGEASAQRERDQAALKKATQTLDDLLK